jgi:hypothetical protein
MAKRGGENWLLKGAANTNNFHRMANGRKRKCLINQIVEGEWVIESEEELKTYITEFYKQPFGGENVRRIHFKQEVPHPSVRWSALDQ